MTSMPPDTSKMSLWLGLGRKCILKCI